MRKTYYRKFPFREKPRLPFKPGDIIEVFNGSIILILSRPYFITLGDNMKSKRLVYDCFYLKKKINLNKNPDKRQKPIFQERLTSTFRKAISYIDEKQQ